MQDLYMSACSTPQKRERRALIQYFTTTQLFLRKKKSIRSQPLL